MQVDLYKNTVVDAKPFLKWAGGKRQLLDDIDSRLPQDVKKTGKIDKYFEPFVGGGAVFFHLKNNYKIKESYLYDINKELILTYNVIKNNPKELINQLLAINDIFLPKEQGERKDFFNQIRKSFNKKIPDFDFENYDESHIERASQTIFMNKTCFNGLFRLNRKGEFNVPCGVYKNPKICDTENILNVSKVLKNTQIINSSYFESERLIDEKSFVYLDPPYRPLTQTEAFTSYSENDFDDTNQIELSQYYKRISEKGAKAMLSNSDPKNIDKNDDFLDDLYSDFKIERVFANRSINSNAKKRGKITEILVTNY